MDEQHPKFVVDSQLARKRLARAFELGRDEEPKQRFSPSFVHQIWRRTSVERPGAAKRNVNGCGFLVLLVHLSEFAATQTDNLVFWLLAGPTPVQLL
jgi:hypothetical protein